MRRFPTLVHLLVCLAIFLNGIAAAQASARMLIPSQAASSAAQVTRDLHHSTASCHSSAVDANTAVDPDASLPQKPTPPSDCCQAGDCACGCASQFQLGIAAATLDLPAIIQASSARSMILGRLAPALPHLIRPPIG